MGNSIDPKHIPFFGLIAVFYYALSGFIVVATFGMAIVLLPMYWKRVMQAKTNAERVYFCMQFAAWWCFFYMISVIIILTIDENFTKWGIIHWWPSISFILFDWDMQHANSVGCDIFLSALIVPITIWIGSWFGTEQGIGTYKKSDFMIANEACADVLKRYNAFLTTDPSKDPNWNKLPSETKRIKKSEYETKLQDMKERVRVVHGAWNRTSPV